jgi:hypothetical protein
MIRVVTICIHKYFYVLTWRGLLQNHLGLLQLFQLFLLFDPKLKSATLDVSYQYQDFFPCLLLFLDSLILTPLRSGKSVKLCTIWLLFWVLNLAQALMDPMNVICYGLICFLYVDKCYWYVFPVKFQSLIHWVSCRREVIVTTSVLTCEVAKVIKVPCTLISVFLFIDFFIGEDKVKSNTDFFFQSRMDTIFKHKWSCTLFLMFFRLYVP